MWYAILWTAAAVVALLALRWWLLVRVGPAPPPEPFDGDVYRLGAGHAVVREVADPQVSVVVMHGFLEDFRYFVDFYDDPRLQFIGLVSGDYHLTVDQPRYRPAPWGRVTAAVGTIRHDAEMLCQVLEHLVRTPRVRVHGHSRGGAVIVEAARLRPELFSGVEVILEAPVLPGGQVYKPMPSTVYWLLPLLVPIWRLKTVNFTNMDVWGRLDIPRKRQLIDALPFGPRRIATMLTNLRDMNAWMTRTSETDFEALAQGAVLVPEKDRVLCPEAMGASARRASGLEVIHIVDCSHFVRFDRPDTIPPLTRQAPRQAVTGSRTSAAGR